MAREKQTRRMIAMALAAAVTMSSVPVVAFAEDGVTTGSGTAADPYITETKTENTTITETEWSESIETTSQGFADEAPETVVESTEFSSTVTETVTETETEQTTTEDGESVKTQVNAPDVMIEDMPEVRVELEQGKVTTGSATGTVEKVTEIEGGTTVTVADVERIVQAALSKEEVKEDLSTTDMDSVIAPEDYEGKADAYDKGVIGPNNQTTGLLNGLWKDPDTGEIIDKIEKDYNPSTANRPTEGAYDYQFVGDGEGTWAASPVFLDVVYVKDDAGNTVFEKNEDGTLKVDKNGKPIPVINWEKSTLAKCPSNSPAIYSGMNSVMQMVLKNDDGEYFYAYCIDSGTPAKLGTWYEVSNLEDNDYYPDEASANKLRAIVENGYWGTAPYETDIDGNIVYEKDADGNVLRDGEGQPIPVVKTGSVEKMKDLLRDTYKETDTVTVKDKNGNDVTYNIYDLIDGLKEHEALACTQGAIWSFSNGSLAAQNGEDGKIVIGVQSADKKFNSKGGWINAYYPDYNTESDARMKALYECLIGLDGKAADDVVINEKNSFDTTALVIGDKADGYAENTDDNHDNDVYNTSVEFTLAFVPDDDDNIHVFVLKPDGTAMTDASGAPITKRLLKAGSTVQDDNAITPDANGAYTLSGLVFQENTNVQFNLQLQGMQNLEQGVYIYQAHGGREASQTLVGLAGGAQDVDVTKSMTLTFDVDETNTVTATSKWHRTKTTPKDPTTSPEDPTTPPGGGGGGDTPTTPVTEDIFDEEVPLADLPDVGEEEEGMVLGAEDAAGEEEGMVLGAEDELIAATGDSNHMMGAFGGMFAALAGMFMLRKKKEN